jgi:uncharacterized protein (DUF433 family)
MKAPRACGGRARIDEARVRVYNLVAQHKAGASGEKTREPYPDLTPAQIHAALAYYYNNREGIDADLAGDEASAQSLDR